MSFIFNFFFLKISLTCRRKEFKKHPFFFFNLTTHVIIKVNINFLKVQKKKHLEKAIVFASLTSKLIYNLTVIVVVVISCSQCMV